MLGNAVESEETQVVQRELVLDARIAEPEVVKKGKQEEAAEGGEKEKKK